MAPMGSPGAIGTPGAMARPGRWERRVRWLALGDRLAGAGLSDGLIRMPRRPHGHPQPDSSPHAVPRLVRRAGPPSRLRPSSLPLAVVVALTLAVPGASPSLAGEVAPPRAGARGRRSYGVYDQSSRPAPLPSSAAKKSFPPTAARGSVSSRPKPRTKGATAAVPLGVPSLRPSFQ
jgi:hypothetical protein